MSSQQPRKDPEVIVIDDDDAPPPRKHQEVIVIDDDDAPPPRKHKEVIVIDDDDEVVKNKKKKNKEKKEKKEKKERKKEKKKDEDKDEDEDEEDDDDDDEDEKTHKKRDDYKKKTAIKADTCVLDEWMRQASFPSEKDVDVATGLKNIAVSNASLAHIRALGQHPWHRIYPSPILPSNPGKSTKVFCNTKTYRFAYVDKGGLMYKERDNHIVIVAARKQKTEKMQAEVVKYGFTSEIKTHVANPLAQLIFLVWKSRNDLSKKRLDHLIRLPVPCAFVVMTAKVLTHFRRTKSTPSRR